MTDALLAELGPPLLKMKVVCENLNICETTGYALVKPGPNGEPPKLKSVRVGAGNKGIRVTVAALKEYKARSEAGVEESQPPAPLPPAAKPSHLKPRKIQPRAKKPARQAG